LKTFTADGIATRKLKTEKISAAYRDGVLEIEVPKKEEAKPKQIRIEVK